MPLTNGNFTLEARNSRLVLQAWSERRTLVRRVLAVHREDPGRVELVVERFARKEGRLFLIDLARPCSQGWEARGSRLVFRERFRRFLAREFPGWRIAELSAEPDLEHSLSPLYPRALLVKGSQGRAAIATGGDPASAGILTFGLIWLDYLRRREPRLALDGLTLLLPCGQERATGLRLAFLNPAAASCEMFCYSREDYAIRVDPRDCGNLDTRLDVCHRPATGGPATLDRLRAMPGVEAVERHDGVLSLRVNGLEFGQARANELRFGLAQWALAGEHNAREAGRLAAELVRARSPETTDREHPLYRRDPEAWLESRIRAGIDAIDASLLEKPVYGQVPAFAAAERSVIDLLAVDRAGRLAILELKAAADVHLPLQALDYWMRVKWHLDRGEFEQHGYFPGIALRGDAPRLLLIAPALEFHPTTEALLAFLAPSLEVERIGLAAGWRKHLDVMFRLRGASRPL